MIAPDLGEHRRKTVVLCTATAGVGASSGFLLGSITFADS
jgi:hypothetical protein